VERCTSCQYYDRNQRNGDAKSPNAGQCRRAAPMLSPINQKSYMIEGVWPTVRDDDWCGEWKALVRRVDPSRLSEVLSSPLPAMPSSIGTGAPPAMPPMPPSLVSVQAARAALSSLGIDSRPASPPAAGSLTGTGTGDD
jgi:hypothetical protein